MFSTTHHCFTTLVWWWVFEKMSR